MASSDRRESNRFQTSLPVEIRFSPDGVPMQGKSLDIGPNGMRLLTLQPLVEATLIHISFQNASNNTHCEGRVVWTQRSEDNTEFESGVDIQRWGGGVPGSDVIHEIPDLKQKKDRRNKSR